MTVGVIDSRLLSEIGLPGLSAASDKEERGQVLVAAGGRAVPGAAILTGVAVLRAGAGKLTVAATREGRLALGIAVPEALVVPAPQDLHGEFARVAGKALAEAADGCDAVVFGPGMLNAATASRAGLDLLEAAARPTYVIDAAALPALEGATAFAAASRGRVVLTPHAGEMAAMLGRTKEEILDDPLDAARDAAARFQAVVVMKGATTFVVSPTGAALRHDGGVAGLGTSGSGDVLAGAIGGFLARGLSPVDACAWGVASHAAAGAALALEVGKVSFLAREILDRLPAAIQGLEAPGEP